MKSFSGLGLFLLFLAVCVAPLGVRPLLSPDETRYAEIAREMIESGDYVAPRLDGFRYFEKPVLGYWLFAGSMNVFGQNAFAVRLPCVLAAGLAAWAVFLLVRRFAGGYWPGLMAAAIYLGMPLVFALSSVAILDGILTAFLTSAIALFFCALSEEESKGRKLLFLIGTGFFCGLAFLTKGFLAFAVPALTAAGFLIWERRWKDFLVMPWIPAVVALLVALPWGLAIHQAEPSFWNYFFWVEHIQRFFKDSYQHSEPLYFFIPVLLGGAAPWVFVLPAIAFGLKEAGLKNPLLKYCVCWLVLPFIFFSISRGKLPPYILPCFAPLAILVAAGLHKYNSRGWRIEFDAGIWPLLGILSVGVLGLSINHFTGFPEPLFLKGETWKWAVGAVAIILWIAALTMLLREGNYWRKLALFCAGPVPLMLASHFLLPDRVAERKAPEVFLSSIASKVAPETVLASYKDPVQAVCWTFKRKDVWLFLKGGELDDGLKFSDSSHRLLDIPAFNKLLDANRGQRDVVLVLVKKIYNEVKESLPEPKWSESDGGPKGYIALGF